VRKVNCRLYVGSFTKYEAGFNRKYLSGVAVRQRFGEQRWKFVLERRGHGFDKPIVVVASLCLRTFRENFVYTDI